MTYAQIGTQRIIEAFYYYPRFMRTLVTSSICAVDGCKRPAVAFDTFWPYHNEYNRCEVHDTKADEGG